VSKRKSRERQLAKLAARRAAERRHQRRMRITAGAVAFAVAAGGGLVAFVAFTGGKAKPSPSPAASASTSPTPTPAPSYSPGTGKQTGTVKPEPAPSTVACGAKAPPGAGKPKPQFNGPPPLTIDPSKTYIATMATSCGTIKIKLLADQAPITVNSFVFLAEHHYFDGQYFHRLDTSIDVVQGGDPVGTGTGGPGYSIPDELQPGASYTPGTLAMANGGPNTGGSQFFLITGPKGTNLDQNPAYAIFGTVIAGLDVAQRIQQLPIKDPQAVAQGDLSGQQPKDAVYIDEVTITVKGPSESPTPSTSPTPKKSKKPKPSPSAS